MTNLLRSGVNWLENQLMTYAAEQLLYQDVAQGVVGGTGLVTATPGRSDFETADFDGVVVRSSSFDWLVKHDDLKTYSLSMQDGLSQPKRGDYLLWAIDNADLTAAWAALQPSPANPVSTGIWRVFEVAPLAGGTFDFEDPYSKMLRLHTKYLGVVTARAGQTFP